LLGRGVCDRVTQCAQVGDPSPWPREGSDPPLQQALADLVAGDANEADTRLLVTGIRTLSVIDRIGSVDNPMPVRRTSGTLAEDGGARADGHQ
jgi:hypothetical protein